MDKKPEYLGSEDLNTAEDANEDANDGDEEWEGMFISALEVEEGVREEGDESVGGGTGAGERAGERAEEKAALKQARSRELFRRNRRWWAGSILSASQLGEVLSDAVLESEVRERGRGRE